MGFPTILLATMSLDLGGAETHVIGLAKELVKRGRRVLVASFGGRLVPEISRAGASHVRMNLHSRSPFSLAALPWQLAALVRRHEIDLIHAHARIPAWASHVSMRLTGVPFVTTYHCPFVSGFPWKYVTKPGLRTIVVSEDIGEYVVREFGFDRSNIRVIHNGIDTGRFTPENDRAAARREIGLEDGEGPVLVHLSRLTQDLSEVAVALMRSARMLLLDHPKLKVLVAGDGPALPRVRQEAARFNEEADRAAVAVLGGVTDTPPLYAAADIVVGMSRVALEAMASERPVVIAGPEGIAGIPDPGNWEKLRTLNFTCRKADSPLRAEGLADAIRILLKDPGRASETAAFGRSRVLEQLSMSWMARETERVYREVLPGYPAEPQLPSEV